MRLFGVLAALLLSFATVSEAGTITRPVKTFGGTTFINGVVPDASDFNGDIDTIYSEFNGSISNANISASAAIAGSKISPDFTSNANVTTASPCMFLDESDQSADARRWYLCVASGTFSLSSRTDAGVLQASRISINRSTGETTLNGSVIWNLDNTYDLGASTGTRPRDLYLGRNAVVGGTLSVTGAVTLSTALGNTSYTIKSKAVIAQQEASGTGGGTCTSGDWRTISLNTEVYDPDGLVSISSSQFTLAAGTYRIHWSLPFFKTDQSLSRLRNTTDSSTPGGGTSAFSSNSGSYAMHNSTGDIRMTITGSKTFEIQGYCSTTFAASGFGLASSLGTEQYTTVTIEKE